METALQTSEMTTPITDHEETEDPRTWKPITDEDFERYAEHAFHGNEFSRNALCDLIDEIRRLRSLQSNTGLTHHCPVCEANAKAMPSHESLEYAQGTLQEAWSKLIALNAPGNAKILEPVCDWLRTLAKGK